MRILVKVGGTLLDEPSSLRNVAGEIARLGGQHEVTVVHGGGKQMTRFLEERGITSRFVNGLRVSDEAVIDAAAKIIAGSVNKTLVAAITAARQRAIGLSGIDGCLTQAVRMSPDLGFVGQPVSSNGKLLDLLVGAGYLPVVACIAGDEDGTIYNVNADQMAVSCAVAFRAEKLIFLTDVHGVKNENGEVLSHLTASESKTLIESGVAHGGMQAKLEAASLALSSGVNEVVIAPGQHVSILVRLMSGERLGTSLFRAAEARSVAQ